MAIIELPSWRSLSSPWFHISYEAAMYAIFFILWISIFFEADEIISWITSVNSEVWHHKYFQIFWNIIGLCGLWTDWEERNEKHWGIPNFTALELLLANFVKNYFGKMVEYFQFHKHYIMTCNEALDSISLRVCMWLSAYRCACVFICVCWGWLMSPCQHWNGKRFVHKNNQLGKYPLWIFHVVRWLDL
jgi:hypothetical protein